MTRPELIRALRRMTAETGSLVCLGCGHEHNCDIKGCAIIRAAAEELEKIEAEPVRRGRWVKKNDSPLDGEYCCSNCKQEIDIADGEETPLNRGMNYCPSCGADMREEAGEDG